MKQVSKPIIDFIRGFDLEHPIKGACFEANIFIYTDKLTLQFESEVHIITITAKALDAVYILNPEIALKGFPDMFEASEAVTLFREKKGLLLKGSIAPHGSYVILIQPNGKDCETASQDEMLAEMNN